MTTILADAKLKMMVSDSNVSDDDRSWSSRKVFRSRGALVGFAGEVLQWRYFLDWWKSGATESPDFPFEASAALVLDDSGLYLFDESTIQLTKVDGGREAVGTGGKAAIAAYQALGWKNPRKAVGIAVQHDAQSRAPIRAYRL